MPRDAVCGRDARHQLPDNDPEAVARSARSLTEDPDTLAKLRALLPAVAPPPCAGDPEVRAA